MTKVGRIDNDALRQDLRRRTGVAADSRHEVRVTLGWVDEGSRLLLEALQRLSDEDLGAPTALAGWTRAHLLAHLARNAEALGRLLAWARTGVETPMYASPARRDADIDAGAAAPGMLLRAEVSSSARALHLALSRFPSASWQVQVRSASGRLIPAAEVPWMRAREVWLHTIDLQGPGPEVVLPDLVAQSLITDVCSGFDRREDAPAFTLRTSDGGVAGQVHHQEGGLWIEGSLSDLALWLTGRSDGARLNRRDAGALPALPAWL